MRPEIRILNALKFLTSNMNTIIIKYISVLCFLCFSITVMAQNYNDRDYIRKGNRLYNDSLYEKLKKEYESNDRITVLRKTDKMAFYMKSSDIFITKPGGLSSTEAAVANVPLIHISPIPGCETKNALFFKNHGLSIFANDSKELLIKAVKKIRNKEYASEMLKKQRKIINPFATADICDYIEQEL